jgi:hypothetical protein
MRIGAMLPDERKDGGQVGSTRGARHHARP